MMDETLVFPEFGPLELRRGSVYYPHAHAFNLARNAFRVLLRVRKIEKIFMPYWICPVMIRAAQAEGTAISFYAIDETFMPQIEPDVVAQDVLLYPNYFGVMTSRARQVCQRYAHVILDNAQGFFAPAFNAAALYSARKFFGVPDGAYLHAAPLDYEASDSVSYKNCAHLLSFHDTGALNSYKAMIRHEEDLDSAPIHAMAALTQRLLENIDYEDVKQRRKANFKILHERLGVYNGVRLAPEADDVPMAYLFVHDALTPDLLAEKNIFSPQFWPESVTPAHSFERRLQTHAAALSVHQMFDESAMVTQAERILRFISK